MVAVFSGCMLEEHVEVAVSERINTMRVEAGRQSLQYDARLTEIARARSADMASSGYFGHRPPDGCDYACLMDQQGVPHRYAGETIAWNTHGWSQTTNATVAGWAASPPHRAKLLDCRFQRFGTGVAVAADGRIFTTTVFEGAAAC
jgi:uncharacterized protein YkwD